MERCFEGCAWSGGLTSPRRSDLWRVISWYLGDMQANDYCDRIDGSRLDPKAAEASLLLIMALTDERSSGLRPHVRAALDTLLAP